MFLTHSTQERHNQLATAAWRQPSLEQLSYPWCHSGLLQAGPGHGRKRRHTRSGHFRAACSDLCSHCSFSAPFWTQSYGELTSSAKWLTDKCVRRASGARGVETGGKGCASWLKFKPTSQCLIGMEKSECRMGNRVERQMMAIPNCLKEPVRQSRAKSASQIPLSKRQQTASLHLLHPAPLVFSHPAHQAEADSQG